MKVGVGVRGTLLLLTTLVLAPACGGGGDAIGATLTDDGCAYTGDTTPAAEPFMLELANESRHLGGFLLFELAAGHARDEIEPAFEQARREAEQGRTPTPLEFFKRPVANAEVVPGATSVVRVDESAGRYALVCFAASSADTRTSSNEPQVPAHVYAPVELSIGED